MLVGARVTAAPSPPFGRQRWIPANAGIQRFSQFCSVALDARVRGHDTQGAWIARTSRASLAVKREDAGVVALLILVVRLLELGARGAAGSRFGPLLSRQALAWERQL
jgi:hypothetical protein